MEDFLDRLGKSNTIYSKKITSKFYYLIFPVPFRRYWEMDGLVTGGQWDSKEGCQPYEIPKCDHHTTGM